MTRADVQAGLLQPRGCLRVLSWVLCYVPFLSTTSNDISTINRIAHDVGVIVNYSSENGFKLNLTKSKVLVLGSRAFVSRIDLGSLPLVMVGGTCLLFVSEARNLGVVMSSDLSWRSHVMSISRRVHFTLYRLRFHRRALTRELRSALIVSLVFPIVDYCCLVWNHLSGELNTEVQRLMNCDVRFLFDLKRDVHISPYRCQLGWLSVRRRR